ncbi:MlaE family lipid ABC transporter permease subunit [candidate division KSB1 bacterium]|nr:MlaE family lipid ABC transporter permease subunit [candidate division KSB1 bacterium]
MVKITYSENRLVVQGQLLISELENLEKILKFIDKTVMSSLEINLAAVNRIDSAGVAFLDEILERGKAKGLSVQMVHAGPHIAATIAAFSSRNLPEADSTAPPSIFENIGGWLVEVGRNTKQLLYLISDSAWFAVTGLFHKKGVRKGEFIRQSIIIGMNSFPIVALISFLVGLILALQSAAQLRIFGAGIYVADLVAISMTREMGPLMTAIVFAGRSGSAIASEIATMVVTEETDALKSMALNPVRYVLVPKIYAITLTMPLLTVLSIILGILGALVIGMAYLDIGPLPFYNEVLTVLILKDLLTGLIKSVIFAWIIVLVGAYYGFRVRGGAQGVGSATTASVVASIFLVILADSLLGLLFYFGGGADM